MSANDERPGREIAHRLFAAEYDDASLSYAESDRERAPNYVITPTGARVNRLFVVGTVTEITAVNEDMLRARVVDPTGAFVVYAGQYQPDELAALESLEPPAFVAITGKARTFQPDDSDRVYTSIRPESVATVDADTRDRWVIDAADRTIDRIETYAAAAELDADDDALTEALLETGVDEGPANGIPLAQSHYGTTPGYLAALRDLSVEAVEVVAGERDQVGSFETRPGEAGSGGIAFADLTADTDLSSPDAAEPTTEVGSAEPDAPAETAVESVGGSETAAVAGTAAEGTSAAESTADESAAEGTEPEPTEIETEPDEPAPTAETAEPASVEEPAAVDEGSTADVDDGTAPPAVDEPPETSAEFDDTVDETAPTDDAVGDDLGDFDAGGEMYEMNEEERERIESEFGAEFSTGTEVDEPGEADIDVPDDPIDESADDGVGDEADPAAEAVETDVIESGEQAEPAEPDGESAEAAEEPAEAAEEPAETADDSGDDSVEDEPAEDVDVQDLVVETMTELDEGGGADRDAVVEAVVEETGLSEDAVEDAIQDALMGGQCYEPDDGTLKAI